MKFPKTKRTNCPKCKEHTEHKVSVAKSTGNRSTLSKGSISRAKKRGLGRGFGNLGKYGSKPPINKWKRTGAKISKTFAVVLTCKKCNKGRIQSGNRVKKVELK